jgi:hypothetical protein
MGRCAMVDVKAVASHSEEGRLLVMSVSKLST